MVIKSTFVNLSGCLFLLLLSPGKAWSNEAPLPQPSFGSEAATQAEGAIAQDAPFEAEAALENKQLNYALGSSEAIAGAESSAESTWVTDSLVWLDQAVVAQASRPISSGQVNDPELLSSSTSSRDLQPVASPSATENLFQTPSGQTANIAQATSTESPSEQWHFLLVPYVYVPFFISGSATFQGEAFRNDFVGDFSDPTRDFDFTPSQIRAALRNSLNFAFFSGFEAWNPDYKAGVLANIDYVSLSTDSTVTRDVRIPGAADFVPTELNAALNTQLWRADLAGSYRFYDPERVNPEGVNSEYDLGPFVFDVLGGLSLTSISTELGLSTNLGGEGQFDRSRTVVSPLIGGRVRWNANPKLAVVGTGTVSGFGISGLMQYGIQGGIDWMFSGNTTLGVGYRFGFLNYNSSNVDLNVNQNGPYLNFGFRF